MCTCTPIVMHWHTFTHTHTLTETDLNTVWNDVWNDVWKTQFSYMCTHNHTQTHARSTPTYKLTDTHTHKDKINCFNISMAYTNFIKLIHVFSLRCSLVMTTASRSTDPCFVNHLSMALQGEEVSYFLTTNTHTHWQSLSFIHTNTKTETVAHADTLASTAYNCSHKADIYTTTHPQ